MKRRKVLAVVLVTVAGGAAILLGIRSFRDVLEDKARRAVETRLARAVGGTVGISRLRFSLFPTTLRLMEVNIEKRGNRGSEAQGTLRGIVVRAGVMTLIGRGHGPMIVVMEGPRVQLTLAEGREVAGGGGGQALVGTFPAGSSLEVKDAEVEIGYHNGPRAHLSGLRFEASPGPGGADLHGRFEFTGGDYQGPGGDWKGLRGEGSFKTTPDGVALDAIGLHAEGFAISGGGLVKTGARVDLRGEIEVAAEMERLAPFLPADSSPTGRVEAQLKGSWESGVAKAQGAFEAAHVGMWGLEAGSLRGEIRIEDGVHLTGIRAHLFGGEVTGSADVVLEGERYSVASELRVDGVDAAQVLQYAGWRGPSLQGTIHYRGQHQIDSTGIGSLRGSGVVDAVGHFLSAGGVELPLEVTSNLTTEGETIRLKGGTMRAGSTRGDFSGTVARGQGIRLRLTGATGNLSEILPLFGPPPRPAERKKGAAAPSRHSMWRAPAGAPPALAVILPAALIGRIWSARPAGRARLEISRADPPPAAPPSAAGSGNAAPSGGSALERILHALGGQWEWDGALEFAGGGLSFEGTLAGRGLTLKGIDLGSLQASIVYRDEDLSIRDACARLADGGSICLDGHVGFLGEGSMAIRATTTDYPFGPILEMAGIRLPLEGRLDGTILLSGRPSAPSGRVHLKTGTLTIAGLGFDALAGDLLFTPDLLETQGITLSQGSGTVTLNGPIPYRSDAEWLAAEQGTEPRRLSIVGRGLDLSRWSERLGGLPIEGSAEVEGVIGGSIEAPEGTLTVRGAGVRVRGAELGEVNLDAHLTGDAATVRAGIPAQGTEIAGRVTLSEGTPVALTATLSGTELRVDSLLTGAPDDSRMVLSGQVSLEGPLQDRRSLAARLDIQSLNVHAAGVEVASEGPVRIVLGSGRLRLAPAILSGSGTRLAARGEVDVMSGGRFDLVTEGSFDLAAVRLLVPDLQGTGGGEFRLSITGTPTDPSLQGYLQVAAEALRSPRLPFPIADLRGRAVFSDSRLRIESLKFLAGGGPVEGGGALQFGGEGFKWPLAIRQAELLFKGTNVRSEIPEGFRAVSDVDVALRRDQGVTRLSGRIDLVRGVYGRDLRIDSLSGQGSAGLIEIETPTGPLADLELDLKVRAASDLWLRSDFGSVEGHGELTIRGSPGRPTVYGRITAIEGGTIRFRNVSYRVLRGTIDFSEPEGIDPIFDLEAETRVADYQVTLRVEGKMDDFQYELASTPPLPQQDIVALLLTGRSPGPFGTEGKGFAGELAQETVSSYLTGRLTDELASRLTGRGGFDVVVIDPLQVNVHGDPTTRVTIGKQVTPDLFVTYSDELGSTRGAIYQLDYALTRDFHFTSLRDRDGSIGGDFRFIHRGAPEPLRASEESTANAPILGSIRLEGDLRFKERRILGLFRLKPGRARDRATLSDGVERVLRYYRGRGFLMVEVDPEETGRGDGRVDLVVRVHPGPLVNIQIEGVRGREGLRQRLELLWEREISFDDIVDQSRERIESEFRARGYQSVRVTPEVRESNTHSFRVLFKVDRGPRARAEAVRVAGSRQIPERQILRQVRTSRDSIFSRGIVRSPWLDADRAAIRDLYLARGFAAASVAPLEVILDGTRERATVTFRVEEGPRVTLRGVRFEGARALGPERLAALVSLRQGSPFTTASAEAAATRLRRAYDDAGYPDARVKYSLAPGVREEDTRNDDLVFSIEEGDRQSVETIEISGNLITRDGVIRKALTVKPGDPLSRADLLASQTRLYGRDIFRSVSVEAAAPEPGVSGSAGPVPRPVRVGVREALPLTQAFGVGYDSEERVRGQYEFSNRNVFGRGRYFGLQTRASGQEQRAVLSFREKGIFAGRFDALASSFWEAEERPAFDVRTIGSSIQIGRRLTRATRILYRYSLKDVDVSDAAASFEGTTLRLSNLAISAVHDTRDVPFDPLRGHYLSGEVQYFGRSIGSEAEFSKMYGQIYLFKEVLPKVVWAQALRAGAAVPFGRSKADPTSTGDDVSGLPPSERFFAGGDTTVRGFRRDRLGTRLGSPGETTLDANGDPIGGEGLFLINEELRFPIYKSLRGVVFYDAGNIYRALEQYDLNDLRHVAGAGLRFATPIGPLRLEYGAILDREEGEPPGELFLSIGQAF